MTPYYLKFQDEAQATGVLNTQVGGEVTEDSEGITTINDITLVSKFVNVSTLGTLYKDTGEVDAEGNPVMQTLEGWHVNVLAEDSPELEEYRVFPITPSRVWG